MNKYQRMYTTLFNAVTDAITLLQNAQAATEEIFISGKDTAITIVEKPEEDNDNTSGDHT